MKKGALSEAEIMTVIMALARGSERRGFTDDEAFKACKFIEGAVIDGAIARMVLNGEVNMSFEKGELYFHLRSKANEQKRT